ncbi:SURF1 family protein [Vibrio sp. FJH11]
MEPPVVSLSLSKRFWIVVCLTVAVFSLLVKLGFWQLDRGMDKQALEQSILARADLPYQEMNTVLDNNDWREESVIGVKVKAQITPEPLPVILLDNQTYDGNVGYLAYQVVSVSQEQNILALMELGFVAGERSRAEFPVVKELEVPALVTGRLYRKSMNPLSFELMPELGATIRVQNLNISQLNNLLNVELMPAVLQPDNLDNWPYAFPWNPLPLTSAKHFGYSVQWFAMAGVFLLLTIVVFIRWLRAMASHGGEA